MPKGSARVVFSLSRGDGDSVDQPSGKAYIIPNFGKLAWSKEHSQSEQGVRWGNTLQIDGWMKRLPGMSTLLASAGNQVGDKPFSAHLWHLVCSPSTGTRAWCSPASHWSVGQHFVMLP